MNGVKSFTAVGLFLISMLSSPCFANGLLEDIQPVSQRTPMWCWAAVGEMVFRHYDVPDIGPYVAPLQLQYLDPDKYQCGIVSLYGAQLTPYGWVGPCLRDCARCVVGAGQFNNIRGVLSGYPVFTSTFTHQPQLPLTTTIIDRPLPQADVIAEIDAGRPIIAGVSPSGPTPGGEAEHVVLIVGYDNTTDNNFYLIVNEPFPFDQLHMPNPYDAMGATLLEPGRYKVEYSKFATTLRWTRTAYSIQRGNAARGDISNLEIVLLSALAILSRVSEKRRLARK